MSRFSGCALAAGVHLIRGDGEMIEQELEPKTPQPITLSDRRQFLAIPLTERRQLLAELADRAMENAEHSADQQQRSEWQGGDIIEY
jgi:hypothetical protein